MTAAAVVSPASSSPAPADCGSSSLVPVQLVCSPLFSGSSATTLVHKHYLLFFPHPTSLLKHRGETAHDTAAELLRI